MIQKNGANLLRCVHNMCMYMNIIHLCARGWMDGWMDGWMGR